MIKSCIVAVLVTTDFLLERVLTVVCYTLNLTVVYDIFQMTAHESNSASSLVWMDLITSMQAILM